MNIEFYGFNLPQGDSSRKELLDAVWSSILSKVEGGRGDSFGVTIVEAQTQNSSGRSDPFVRVYSSEESDFNLVKEILSGITLPGAGSCTYVECVPLSRCFLL